MEEFLNEGERCWAGVTIMAVQIWNVKTGIWKPNAVYVEARDPSLCIWCCIPNFELFGPVVFWWDGVAPVTVDLIFPLSLELQHQRLNDDQLTHDDV